MLLFLTRFVLDGLPINDPVGGPKHTDRIIIIHQHDNVGPMPFTPIPFLPGNRWDQQRQQISVLSIADLHTNDALAGNVFLDQGNLDNTYVECLRAHISHNCNVI